MKIAYGTYAMPMVPLEDALVMPARGMRLSRHRDHRRGGGAPRKLLL
ncbi:hypothetical protein J7M22_15120 [Candidatus Poribacteria bacterium]|nr:hypothetical protein [Candidatus Poribacteria bacterium]